MSEKVSKSRFKAKALEFFRRVEKSRKELIITDHGRPVLKLVPYTQETSQEVLQGLAGSVLKYEDPTEPVGLEDWEALK